ncbi:MAG: GNAT family N-acetyltransferase [Pseudolabrys sp.]
MHVRPATAADIPAITHIYAHAVTHGTASFELAPSREAEMAARMRALRDGGLPYVVAEADGAVAGYAYASFYRARPAYRFAIEDSVYVAPAMQRRGIGKALLEKLIADCSALGYRQMIAVIGDSEQAASIAVHEACGFAPGREGGQSSNHGVACVYWVPAGACHRAALRADPLAGDGSGTWGNR